MDKHLSSVSGQHLGAQSTIRAAYAGSLQHKPNNDSRKKSHPCLRTATHQKHEGRNEEMQGQWGSRSHCLGRNLSMGMTSLDEV